jgi:hypothetical protein
MNSVKKIILAFTITSTIMTNVQSVLASSSEAQKIARNIKSVSQVKEYLRETMSPCEGGCSGYGLHIRAMRVCELVEAVDIKVKGKITRRSPLPGKSMSISKSDLNLMRLIYSQCKWYVRLPNDPPDFVYHPKPEIERKINRKIGI